MDRPSRDNALELGGWHPRYARLLALSVTDVGATAVIDSNGDGNDVNLDEYIHLPGEGWQPGSSGTFSSGVGEHTAHACGQAEPGSMVRLAYAGEEFEATCEESGWWAFVTATDDPGDFVGPRRIS